MSEQTKIAWCDSTVNPVHGCDKISAGCANCYITTTNPFRVSGMKHGDPRTFHPSALKLAEKLNRKPWVCDECGEAAMIFGSCGETPRHICKCDPTQNGTQHHRRRIFWESLGDIWDDKWPIEWLAQTLDTIRRCDQCVHILVSKRWENFESRISAVVAYDSARRGNNPVNGKNLSTWIINWINEPPANIIGLCSVENQPAADERIPQFLTVPLTCRGLSLEPLLGAVDLTKFLSAGNCARMSGQHKACIGSNPTALNWLIIGGESGHNARPCNVDWIRSLVAQGKAAGMATFVKQLGAKPIITRPEGDDAATIMDFPCAGITDKKGGDPAEWPEDLRVQEFAITAEYL